MTAIKWFLLTVVLYSYVCEAYKILVVFPNPSKSHAILGDGYVRYLLEAGHEVTYVTSYPKNNTNPRLTTVDVRGPFHDYMDNLTNITALMNKEIDFRDSAFVLNVMVMATRETILHKNFQKILYDPSQQFDLVIIEWMFSDVYSGLQAVFQCPLIWATSTEPHSVSLSLIDEGTNPAYIPHMQSSYAPPLTFMQRVENLFSEVVLNFFNDVVFVNKNNELFEELFGSIVTKRGRILPPFREVRYNASMILGNSHYSLGLPMRLPQAYVAVGGYHIDTNLKPLPEDLKKIMDNAKNGVIYFSMGSILKSKDMTVELKTSLLEMFGSLKYTVIWKFEEAFPDTPNNVHILKWAPQPSILAHPNTRLFITHGGLLSTTETIHYGKPIIGIPAFGDQFSNVEKAVKKGFAKKVDLSYTMADELKAAIEEILSNPKYAEIVEYLSLVYHDRPVPPGKVLVHWVEHVIRTRGAPHLRSPALTVPWYQKMYLDFFAIVIALLLVLRIVIKRLLCTQKKVSYEKKTN